MLKMTTVVVAASLLVSSGCSKKKEEGTVQKPTEATGSAPPPPPEPVKPLTGTELADRYKSCIELINGSKLDEFKKDCLDAAYTLHDEGDGSTRKVDDLVNWFQSMKAGMPDFKLTPQLIVVSGRTLVAIELVTGTHTAALKTPMGELPASNKKIGTMIFHRLAFNDANKATEEWAYSDPETMMAQLGVVRGKDATPKAPALDSGIDGAPIVAVAADDAKEKANLEAMRKLVTALNERKHADALALIQPDAVEWSNADAKSTQTGHKEIEAEMKEMDKRVKDMKVTLDHELAAGDYVVHLATFTATLAKPVGPIKATGKQFSVPFADVVLVKDGKEAKLWHFHSDLRVVMQLAPELLTPPGAPAGAGSAAPAAGSAN